MLRRLVWALTALTAALALPVPALSLSSTEAAPKVHVAGIGRSVARDGAGPIEIPRLVRPGSDDGREGGGVTGSTRATAGALAPVVAVPAFDGVPDQEVVSPGDPTGALGQTYHLAAVNVRMAFYDRAGVELDPPRLLENLDSALPGGADSFDPKVVYDPYRQHFVLTFLSATATQSFISVVVIPEGSEDTTNDWCVLHMSGDQVGNNGKQFADYPMVGFTEDRVTLTTNQFDFSNAPAIGGFDYVQVVSIRKAPLYDCSVPVVPIKVFSGAQTEDPGRLSSVHDRAHGVLRRFPDGPVHDLVGLQRLDRQADPLAVEGRRRDLAAHAGAGHQRPDGLPALRTAVSGEPGRSQRQLGHRRPPAHLVLLGRGAGTAVHDDGARRQRRRWVDRIRDPLVGGRPRVGAR